MHIDRAAVLYVARPLIMAEEGLRLHAYPDPATHGEPWTIGYGHTGGVRSTDVITQQQADTLLEADMTKRLAGIVSHVTQPLTVNQAAAILSFVFNVGLGGFYHSTMLHRLNQGRYDDAAREFDRWVYAAGKRNHGLEVRRAGEKALFKKE